MTAPLLYITGTNTAVGKTTLSRLLLQRARERDLRVAAMKPFCTGGRDDAEQLHALQTANLTLEELNPFHFTDPITPYLAARNQNRSITLNQTLASIQKIQSKNLPVLIEGAGGLMSPLGDRFTLLDIINQLPGKICIVAPNILGVINSALLTHRALNLPPAQTTFVLMSPSTADPSTPTNATIIHDWTAAQTHEFPFLSPNHQSSPLPSAVQITDTLLSFWLG